MSSSATGEDVVTTSKDSVGDDPDTAAALHNEDEEAETIASSFDQKLAQLKSNVLAYFSSVSPMVQLLEYSGVIYCPCG
jgi:ABC-type hemin transport system substrate-binding protein